jgi:hypothetical protein
MELEKVIRERRTIQSFTNEKVSDGTVLHALELSLWAPNHRLTFPWRFALIDGQAREKLADLAADLKVKKSPLSETARKAIRATVTAPSHVLMLGLKKSGKPALDQENYATMSCSVQILSLVLWDNGIGSKWSTSGFTMDEKTYGICGWNAADILLAGAVLIGKPQAIPPAPPRPTLAEVLHRHY